MKIPKIHLSSIFAMAILFAGILFFNFRIQEYPLRSISGVPSEEVSGDWAQLVGLNSEKDVYMGWPHVFYIDKKGANEGERIRRVDKSSIEFNIIFGLCVIGFVGLMLECLIIPARKKK